MESGCDSERVKVLTYENSGALRLLRSKYELVQARLKQAYNKYANSLARKVENGELTANQAAAACDEAFKQLEKDLEEAERQYKEDVNKATEDYIEKLQGLNNNSDTA